MCCAGVRIVRAQETPRIEIRPDFSEAEAVMAILAKRSAALTITDLDWEALFKTEPYQRLKKREAGMHRDFTDDEFRRFVLSSDLLGQRNALLRTLEEWKQADLQAAGRRVLPYLPSEAVIRTKVFPVIKPMHNSFVFEADTDPAIFLYLDPAVSLASFENTVAHEMHHIGLGSTDKAYEQKLASLPAAARQVALWMGAFGEGEAMLAAAGGPDVDPVASSREELKQNWARGKREFNENLTKVNDFFLQVLNGKLQGEAVDQRAFEFFGLQGPWYTVGYQMAVIVEKRYGREVLIDCMRDHRLLLAKYNAAADELNLSRQQGDKLAVWSAEILAATAATPR